ncbi:pirin family protein [Hazenella coriacea]|uniref:Pirin N-terminal domain-containing protein n=1 Tax=Hazenella coriacea TaxID=1179467 RepID=A0A4R3L0J8_9BACL|nr:pirin family protein [Hazenella coriacea]TCS92854.1 hypothetical protein EDD58_11081 [Hazenella coriacea]
MIQVIRSQERYNANYGWLDAKYSFSFNRYYDPNNLQFGSLRVFNEDQIQPGAGFGMHSHDNMEIITYVISGALEHQDSLGNKGIIQARELQRMTAGSGIMHSEYNASKSEPLHLLQIWFIPNQMNLTPSWEQKKFPQTELRNQLLPVVSGNSESGMLSIHQDLTIFLSTCDAGKEIEYQSANQRSLYLFVIDGQIQLNEQHTLSQGDTARITQLSQLQIKNEQDSHWMLIDLAE